MSKAKWYNPTKDPYWDQYYKVFYVGWGSFFLLILGLIVGTSLL